MASARETPRQRMIGMMYLVLTALLALQIKDTVLEKFVLMEEGLKTSNGVYENANSRAVSAVQTAYEELGRSEKDLPVVEAVQKIRQETQQIIVYLETWKDSIGAATGKKEPNGYYRRNVLKKYEEPSRLLVELNGADEIRTRMDGYMNSVMNTANSILQDKGGQLLNWKSLALDASEINLYANNPDERTKDFKELNFYKSPLASVLAQFTFFQNQILAREAEALNRLGSVIGASNIKGFDVINATVLPVSNVVTAGTEFEAQVFLTAASSSLSTSMQLDDGTVIPVDSDGKGTIKFPATARNNEYDANGQATKTINGTITFEQDGENITRNFSQTYAVAKPIIEVRSEAIETLYLKCANSLNINVPSLGAAYNPSFRTRGGKSIRGSQKGQVTVVPNSGQVTIDVSSSGIAIGSKTFGVKPVPRPELNVQVDGRNYDAARGLRAAPRQLRLQLIPEKEFAEKYPQDARYIVSKGKIILAAGEQLKRTIPINSPTLNVNVGTLRQLARSGDRIVVSIDEITRVNFEDERETIPFVKTETLNIN